MTAMVAAAPLVIERVIDASLGEAWEAWTQADILASWFAPGELSAEVPIFELRPGGRYRIRMTGGENEHIVGGKFLEILPKQRLVMTWAWEGGEIGETKVIVDFAQRDHGTAIKITHEGLPTAESRASHDHGWRGCLEKLAQR